MFCKPCSYTVRVYKNRYHSDDDDDDGLSSISSKMIRIQNTSTTTTEVDDEDDDKMPRYTNVDRRMAPFIAGKKWKTTTAKKKKKKKKDDDVPRIISNNNNRSPPPQKLGRRLSQSLRSSLSGRTLNSKGELSERLPPLSHKGIAHRMVKKTLRGIRHTAFDDWTLKELIMAFFALIGSVLSLCVIVYDSYFLMDFVAYFCMAFGGSTVFMQRTLTDLESFRKLNNEARSEVEKLRKNNRLLEEQNTKLEHFGEKLKQSEATLQKLGEEQGVSVNMLIEQVENYQRIQQDIRRSVKDQIRQTLISAVMTSDSDNDYTISGFKEMSNVCQRLKAIPMIQFNEEVFISVMSEIDGSILIFIRDYLSSDNDKVLEEEQMFVFLE